MKRATEPVLTLRALNRATLARQMLLERASLGVVLAIERLAALQAQWSPSPYVALWSRLRAFEREQLWRAIEKHQVIRARLMRGTLHLVSARDFYAYAVATQDLQRGAWNRLQVGRGVDPKKIASLAVAFARTPRAKEEVIAHITERVGTLGGPYKWLIWRFVSAHADLVSAPPGGHWAYGGTDAPYVAARHWIDGGGRPSEEESLALLIRRYLGAFGPATLTDVAKFAGQVPARIRPILERVAPSLRRFADEQGRALFDLPRAPRPDPETAAPVRFLPRYDELSSATSTATASSRRDTGPPSTRRTRSSKRSSSSTASPQAPGRSPRRRTTRSCACIRSERWAGPIGRQRSRKRSSSRASWRPIPKHTERGSYE